MNYEKQKKYFENILLNGFLGHAYLLVGQDSVGPPVGEASPTNGEASKKAFAGEICDMLTGKGFENNPDLKLIRPRTEEDEYKIHIEDIRGLKSFISFKPYSSEYKLAVIDNAETLTLEAANAMLKILEEPPKRSVLILISSKPKLLPRTILSRCETVIFSPAPEVQTDEMRSALAELRKVARQNISERIKYVKKIHEKDDYAVLVNLWLRSLRFQLVEKPATAPVLKNLLRLSYIVSQPQYNHRIALENFFVNI